jgi:peptidoglycan-N-acetylglucosamine deacetylase
VLLSIDFEDWHQLILRQLGDPRWDRPNDAFPRQVRALLDFLDEIEASATFFLLGMTARNYPALVEEVVRRGHEPACHGFGHRRVYLQSPADFRSDLEQAILLIEELSGGRRPVGYRAPAFSLNRTTTWAYEILAELGFTWDSSQYDSPKIPNRLRPIPREPYVLIAPGGARLLEIPLAVKPIGSVSVPLAGGSYWRVLPSGVVARAVGRNEQPPALYFHPYEFDPDPLRVALAPGTGARQRARAAYQHARASPGRHRLRASLRRVAATCKLVSYEQGLDLVLQRYGDRSRTLSEEGVLV